MVVKVTVNLPEDAVEAIREIAARRGTTVTEALRRAIESEKFLDQEIRNDSKILLEKADGSIRQVIIK